MASPSEKLCRPSPTAVPSATWRGVNGMAPPFRAAIREVRYVTDSSPKAMLKPRVAA